MCWGGRGSRPAGVGTVCVQVWDKGPPAGQRPPCSQGCACPLPPLTPSPLLSPSWKAGVTGFPEPYRGQDIGGPGTQVGCPVSISEVGHGHGVFTWRSVYSFTSANVYESMLTVGFYSDTGVIEIVAKVLSVKMKAKSASFLKSNCFLREPV